jgi:hypothetical protein
MRVLLLGVAASALLFAQPGRAQSLATRDMATGNDFYDICRNDGANDIESVRCFVWVEGFINGVGVAESAHGSHTICLTKDITLEQSEAVILKYLSDHPERRHIAISALAFVALRGAFPCPKPTS